MLSHSSLRFRGGVDGEMSTISAVITNFNYGRFLGRAIESVLAQTRPADEIIVVDDGSTDETPTVLNRYRNQIVVIHQSNRGQGAAINAGCRVARGHLIALLDSDDYWAPNRLEVCEEFFWDNPTVGYLHHPASWVDITDSPVPGPPSPALAEGQIELGSAFAQVVPFAPTSCMIIRRSVLEKIGPIPESIFRLRADFFLQTLAPHCTRIGVVGEPLTAYRIHGANGYSGHLSKAKLDADWRRTSDFVQWIQSNVGIQLNPLTNYTYARSAIWVHRTRGEVIPSLRMALSYFFSSVGHGALKRSVFRTLFLASMAIQPQITSWLFNRLLTRLWRA